jgi:hypothetical protein
VTSTKSSRSSQSLPLAFDKDLNSLKEMVKNVEGGIGPSQKETGKMCGLHLGVLRAMEQWIPGFALSHGKGENRVETPVTGKEALLHTYRLVVEKSDKGEPGGLSDDLALCRRFQWCLDAEQSAKIDTLVKAGVRQHRIAAISGMIADGKAQDHCACAEEGEFDQKGSAASSSASGMMASPSALAISTITSASTPAAKKAAKKDKAAAHDMSDAMAKLFGAKATAAN